MVVDGSSKSKKSRKNNNNNGGNNVSNNNGNSNKAVLNTSNPQLEPQPTHQNETSIIQTNNKPRKSIDVISDKQRADLLLEASMTPLNQDYADREDTYESENVHERLHEIDLNLVSDASDENGSESSSPYLTDNEHLNGKLADLTIRSDLPPTQAQLDACQKKYQFNTNPPFNEQRYNKSQGINNNNHNNNINGLGMSGMLSKVRQKLYRKY